MAKGIDIDENDDSMSVKVEYELDMNYEQIARIPNTSRNDDIYLVAFITSIWYI